MRMKKKRCLRVIAVIMILYLCGMQANAAYVPCVAANLTKSQKSNSSSLKLLDASKMYCENTSSSKHNINFYAYGSNNGSTAYIDNVITLAKGRKGTYKVTGKYNYYKIKLVGIKSNGKAVSGCIGFGKIY